MKIIGYVCDKTLPAVTKEEAQKLDIINIAFGHVNRDCTLETGELKHIDAIKRIREMNPRIRFVLSVGGWGCGGFSLMCRTEEGRRIFADSCADYVGANDLDGIDIDWEYPCSDQAGIDADPSDKQNFTALMESLRCVLGPDKIVSIAAGAGQYFIDGTEMDKVAKICSYIQLMTYDMRSGFCTEAGHHTAPYYTAGGRTGFDTKYVAEMFAGAGVPKEKIVLGAAFYSRKWDGVPDVNHGLFQQAATIGQYGPGFAELKEKYINKNGFTRYWDAEAKAPYLFNGSTLISYDDPDSVRAKCEYLKNAGYMGIMYWEHGCDPTGEMLNALWQAND